MPRCSRTRPPIGTPFRFYSLLLVILILLPLLGHRVGQTREDQEPVQDQEQERKEPLK
jgi:hypothetical protein